jgi:hypothetical protein
MVNFSVFNELSLPLNRHQVQENFGDFFALLAELKKLGLNQVRMNDDFKLYNILENTSFQQFIGQQSNRDFKTRLKSFVGNAIIKIDTPIIKNDDLEQNEQQSNCEYFYNNNPNYNGLACADIWNTICISFDSDSQWNKDKISFVKRELDENVNFIKHDIQIKHASKVSHLQLHKNFFNTLQEELKQNITAKNMWNKKNKLFPSMIIFCPEVEQQIKILNKQVFDCAISILRDIESRRKLITNFNNSGESKTICNNSKLKNMRMFTINGKKVFFQKHIKSLPNNNRIYYLEINGLIYIGYIGKHLPLK